LDWARFAELIWVDSDEQTIHLETEEDEENNPGQNDQAEE